jgi:hypothetical protein
MFKFRKPDIHLSSYYEKISMAFEYALARKWKRGHLRTLLNKERPTIGEMEPPITKSDD